ncbi:DUF2304 family protein [Planctomonas sp. JC2975]|uniref:DUF2304 family protein n=1 Tax=Planctomonas sp. JC2975 TaxID=2729626 RepID=UPI001472B519|nr:DUF2304 family protein [Planctomonas sp. JC2975]NNC13078.1 DUF2304 family protein [Planctomonas sp. JC2975]
MVVAAIVLAVIIIVIIGTMLLRRQLREKYAVLWLIIGLLVLILGLFPSLLVWLTGIVGVQLPSNLLFILALLLLLGVTLHLSWELSHSEDETRRLAEDIAILRADVDELRAEHASPQSGSPPTTHSDGSGPDASDKT